MDLSQADESTKWIPGFLTDQCNANASQLVESMAAFVQQSLVLG